MRKETESQEFNLPKMIKVIYKLWSQNSDQVYGAQ